MILCVVVFQVPLFIPALFSFTCLFMVALSLYSDPVNTGIGFAITLTGVPAYYLFIVWDKKPKWFRKLLGKSPGVSPPWSDSRNFSGLRVLWNPCYRFPRLLCSRRDNASFFVEYAVALVTVNVNWLKEMLTASLFFSQREWLQMPACLSSCFLLPSLSLQPCDSF